MCVCLPLELSERATLFALQSEHYVNKERRGDAAHQAKTSRIRWPGHAECRNLAAALGAHEPRVIDL